MISGEESSRSLASAKGFANRKSTEWGLRVKAIGMGYCIVYFVWSDIPLAISIVLRLLRLFYQWRLYKLFPPL